MSWETRALELLSASLLRPLVLVAVAVVVLRLFRVEHPASKHAVWTAVLLGVLVLPIISVFTPHFEFEALPQGTLARLNDFTLPEKPQLTRRGDLLPPAASPTRFESSSTQPKTSPIEPSSSQVAPPAARLSASTILVWVYLGGLILFVGHRVTGWLLLRRLVSRSRKAIGVVRESPDVTVPIAVGVLRPAVLLPAGWRWWDATSRRAVLAHELAHIRRRDVLVMAVCRWTKCIFWFHPLSWWLARHISELAEMACDTEAVDRVGAAEEYSRILLDFAGAMSRDGYRATLPGLAMFGRSSLSRRIEQLFAASQEKPRRLARPVAVLTLIGVPVFCAAATLGLTEAAAQPLRKVQQSVTTKLETVAQVATSEGLVAAVASVLPAPPPEPLQSATTVKAFVDQYCTTCHSSRARSANLVLEEQDLSKIADNRPMWERVVARLRAGLEPKAGQPRPDEATIRNVATWLESELDRSAQPFMPQPGPHRLNRTEYANAIRDVLGLDVNPALLLPSDDYQFGFDTIAKALLMTPNIEPAYSQAAERVTDLAVSNAASRQILFPCRPDPAIEPDDTPCAQRLIDTVATRAFRRPLSESEKNDLLQIYKTDSRRNSQAPYYSFDMGAKAVVRSVLSDPRFVYRTEAEPTNVSVGQTYRVSDLELASRLSYFLWSRGPDEALMEVAKRGQLSNPAVLESETRRMLKDPRANALTVNFGAQWLNLRGLPTVGPLPQYPDFDNALQQAMIRELELFFSSIVQEDRNVLDLLDADYTFVNERLARHYGMPNVSGDQMRRVNLGPEFDVRRGLFGKAAILAVTSRADRTSITTRGKWVLSAMLGSPPPDPPPNVPGIKTLAMPMREVMQMHMVRADCANCHRIMDPIGIALDNFDQTGKWRTDVSGTKIDASAELIDGTKVDGPAGLRNAVRARSGRFVQTFTQKLFTYGMGRGTTYQDMPLIRSIARDAEKDNNRFSAFIVGIVKSTPFQMNTKS